MSKKNTIIVVAYPDRGAGNDPAPLGLAFHHQGSTLLHWEIIMGVMICLGQGGVRSLSASSYDSVFDYQHFTFNHCVIPLYEPVITLNAQIKCIILNNAIYYHRLKNTETGKKKR